MESKKPNKYGILTIIVSNTFMIMQRVLISATVIPDYAQYPKRFYLYNIVLGLTAIGGNLLALYLGFHAEKLEEKKPLRSLSGFYMIYVMLILAINLFCKTSKLSNYWRIVFPISQNMFEFAVSIMLIFMVSPILAKHLKKLSDSQLKSIFILSSIIFVVCPTLFGKDLFGFSDGKGILWIAYLFIVGYVLRRYQMTDKLSFVFLKFIVSGIVLAFLVIIMTRISLNLHWNVSTGNRFSAPWSFFSVYFSINCFVFLQIINKKFDFLKASFNSISFYLIVSQILINWPVVTDFISKRYKVAFWNSVLDWVIRIVLILLIYLLLVTILWSIAMLIQKIPFFKKVEKKFGITDWVQLIECLSQVKNRLYYRRKFIYSGVFFYLFTMIQMLLLSESKTKEELVVSTLTIFNYRQPQLVLNLVIIMLFFLLIFLVTKRFWYAFSFTLAIDLLITVSTILKIAYRREPILPSDLALITNLNEILNMISPIIVITAGAVLVILTASTFLIQRHASKTYQLKINNKKRIISIFFVGFFLSGILWVNQPKSPSHLVFKAFGINPMFYDQKGGAYINGPIVQFINNIVGKSMIEPDGYSKKNLEKIMKKYDRSAKKINADREVWSKEQTVIFVLSESFSDPSNLPGMILSKDPIPFINSLSEQTTSGSMLSSAYGGGTANVEWQTLTSLDLSNLEATLPNPYTQLVTKQDKAPSIVDLFDQAVAIHPSTGSFYNRIGVFKKFGFDRFHYVDSPDGLKHVSKVENNPYVSDDAAYNETLDVINSNKEKSQFIQLITMQNHVPYKDYYKENDYDFEGNAVTDTNKTALKTYLKGLNYTDIALEKFIAKLDKVDKPITLVWYGDHLPGIYDAQEIKKDPLAFRKTNYFVYNNAFIKNRQKNTNHQIVSPYNFSALALEQANIKVTPFYTLLTEVAKNLPATTNNPESGNQNKNSRKRIFVDQKGDILKDTDLSEKQKKLLNDYMLIQYDLVAGKQYSANWVSQKEN